MGPCLLGGVDESGRSLFLISFWLKGDVAPPMNELLNAFFAYIIELVAPAVSVCTSLYLAGLLTSWTTTLI